MEVLGARVLMEKEEERVEVLLPVGRVNGPGLILTALPHPRIILYPSNS